MGSRTKIGFTLDGEDPTVEFSAAADDRKRRPSSKRGAAGAGGAAPASCQVDGCPAVLTEAKRYHRRHKVCEFHAKAAVVVVAGVHQRFCQQCSRFHELLEFDENRRSCRRRLAGHNERRRKGSSSEPLGDASGSGAAEEKNRAGITLSAAGNSACAYTHFQIG